MARCQSCVENKLRALLRQERERVKVLETQAETHFKAGWYARHEWPDDADLTLTAGHDCHEDWKEYKAALEGGKQGAG